MSNYEKTVTGSNTKEIIYLNNAVVITTNGVSKIYYLSTDHLGSIIALIDGNTNTVVERYKYDAWGKRTCSTATPILYRGYTGHEHLGEFELINMNGRMYDPVLGRFLSPDNYVQMPDNTQNYNRYSYCLNNPMMYSDPSGQMHYLWYILAGAVTGGLGGYLLSGAEALGSSAIIGAYGGSLVTSKYGAGTYNSNGTPTKDFAITSLLLGGAANGMAYSYWGNGIKYNDLWKSAIVGAGNSLYSSVGPGLFSKLGTPGLILGQMIGTACASIGYNWASSVSLNKDLLVGIGPFNLKYNSINAICMTFFKS